MAKKTKKVGICRREIDEEGVLGSLFMTDGDLKSAIRSALRRLWNGSTRRIFIEKVRFKGVRNNREVWMVKCSQCGVAMGVSEKSFTIRKDGTRGKRPKSVYDVDHVAGNSEFTNIKAHLGAWAHSVFHGKLQILCRTCHSKKTTRK